MATKTIQLGSGVVPISSLFTFERITTDDTASSSQRITRGLFSGNAASLATFFTSSAQSASSGQYYYDVYDSNFRFIFYIFFYFYIVDLLVTTRPIGKR